MIDDGLRAYLDARFVAIAEQLNDIRKTFDEMSTKLDCHGDRLTSIERDLSYVQDEIDTERKASKERLLECEKKMDTKDSAAIGKIKYWIVAACLVALASISSYIVTSFVLAPIRHISQQERK